MAHFILGQLKSLVLYVELRYTFTFENSVPLLSLTFQCTSMVKWIIKCSQCFLHLLLEVGNRFTYVSPLGLNQLFLSTSLLRTINTLSASSVIHVRVYGHLIHTGILDVFMKLKFKCSKNTAIRLGEKNRLDTKISSDFNFSVN